MSADFYERLAASFPADAIHWRAQTMSRDGTKAMALAYIDARDVMDRLDDVCGPDGWSDSYTETAKGRVVGSIAIRCPDEGWVSKSDGAGDTDVEGAKGGLSDAFKRAGVKWGIGRYLYRLDAVWAECEPLKDGDGKLRLNSKGKAQFKCWTQAGQQTLAKALEGYVARVTDDQRDIIATLAQAAGVNLQAICEGYQVKDLRDLPGDRFNSVCKRLNATIKLNSERKEAA